MPHRCETTRTALSCFQTPSCSWFLIHIQGAHARAFVWYRLHLYKLYRQGQLRAVLCVGDGVTVVGYLWNTIP